MKDVDLIVIPQLYERAAEAVWRMCRRGRLFDSDRRP